MKIAHAVMETEMQNKYDQKRKIKKQIRDIKFQLQSSLTLILYNTLLHRINAAVKSTVDSLYLKLARDQEICSRQRKFEIEEITVKIKIFANKAREVGKGLLGMYQISSLNAQKNFLLKNFKTLYIKLNRCKKSVISLCLRHFSLSFSYSRSKLKISLSICTPL